MIAMFRAAILTTCMSLPAQAGDLTVFAASSLGDVLKDLEVLWETKTGQDLTVALAGSSALARQIDAGAPADVMISANVDWITWLDERARLLPDSLRNIASNELVLIAHDPAAASQEPVTEAFDFPTLLGPDGRLAIALPEAVPAGIYAREALMRLGLWDGVQDRLAPTDNVRAALALVALGETPLGVVYATDAVAEPQVSVAGVFPSVLHPPILYPAAVVAESPVPDLATGFVDWLISAEAQAVFAEHGFLPPGPLR